MQPTAAIQHAEVIAYAAAAARGDVLPVCIRLTSARADADWSLRSHLVWLTCAYEVLAVAARLDPMDPTARSLLAELVGAHAWAAHPSHPMCAA